MRPSYSTTDLYVAGFLLAKGYEIDIVDLSPSKREFRFPDSAEAEAVGFYRNAQLPARLYAAALRDLKSMLYPRAAQREG